MGLLNKTLSFIIIFLQAPHSTFQNKTIAQCINPCCVDNSGYVEVSSFKSKSSDVIFSRQLPIGHFNSKELLGSFSWDTKCPYYCRTYVGMNCLDKDSQDIFFLHWFILKKNHHIMTPLHHQLL